MKVRLLLILCLCSLLTTAQNTSVIDSLLNELPNAKNDTIRARIYIRLHNNLYQHNPEKALMYANKGLKIVTKMNWHKGLSVFNNDIGNSYLGQGKHKEALEYYLKSLEFSKDLPSLRANTLQNTSIVYFQEENIPLATKYNNEAFQLAKKENNITCIADCYNNYGLIFKHAKDLKKANAYFLKSLAIWKQQGDLTKQAVILTHLGDIAEDLKVKIAYYNKSKAIWDQENPSYLLAVSNIFGLVEANISLAKDVDLLKKTEIIKTKKQLLEEAESYLQKAIYYSKESNVQQNLMYSYGKMSEVKELQGNYKAALDYINLNYEIYVSIFSQENKNKIAAIETKEKLAKKDKEIAIKKLTLLQNERQKWYLVGGILLLGIIGFLLFIQNRNRKKSNEKLQKLNSELDAANKAKTRFFSILNHDLRSPVSNLIDFLHLQKDSPDLLDDATKNRIENTTLTSAENLLSSMEDILEWSKSQMENFKPQPKLIELNTLFQDTQNHFSSEESLKIVFQNPSNIQITTDENYLKTIIRNLTGNAIKALNQVQNPTLIWKAWEENNQTFLSITDNGPGGTHEQFKALYDETEVVGIQSGLGLHLIRDLAKAIDCKIDVDSRPNQGTTFTLSFKKPKTV
ncbi:MAG: tetratricopeptide repeat protein [Flavobacterium sp.]|nr:tetratricopeptide repeat protein [Flavobacterium sp.]